MTPLNAEETSVLKEAFTASELFPEIIAHLSPSGLRLVRQEVGIRYLDNHPKQKSTIETLLMKLSG
jgi:hypothetical protein